MFSLFRIRLLFLLRDGTFSSFLNWVRDPWKDFPRLNNLDLLALPENLAIFINYYSNLNSIKSLDSS